MNESMDRALADWLRGGPEQGSIEGLERALAAARRTSQRPGWTFPERWLPMQLTMERGPSARPLTYLVLIALLIAALVGAALIVGSQRRLPAPFGPAENGRIAYVSNGQLWTAASDGSLASALTVDDMVKGVPVWSRDGTRLAFIAYTEAGSTNRASLLVVNADGSGPVTIDEDAEQLRHFSWSPDGRTIAYSKWVIYPGQRDRLFLAAADASSLAHQVGDRDLSAYFPTFSPDGRRILFLSDLAQPRGGEDRFALMVMGLDGSDRHQLTTGLVEPAEIEGTTTRGFEFSPDGTRVLFTGREIKDRGSLTHGLYVVVADASTPERHIADQPGVEFGGSWSPDGRQIAFLRGDPAGRLEVIVSDPDGGNARVVAEGVAPFSPRWSPDGKSLVVANRPAGSTASIRTLAMDTDRRDQVIDITAPPSSDVGLALETVDWQRIAN